MMRIVIIFLSSLIFQAAFAAQQMAPHQELDQATKNKKFLKAARTNNTKKVKKWLKRGAEVSTHQSMALSYALMHDNFEMALMLVRHGINDAFLVESLARLKLDNGTAMFDESSSYNEKTVQAVYFCTAPQSIRLLLKEYHTKNYKEFQKNPTAYLLRKLSKSLEQQNYPKLIRLFTQGFILARLARICYWSIAFDYPSILEMMLDSPWSQALITNGYGDQRLLTHALQCKNPKAAKMLAAHDAELLTYTDVKLAQEKPKMFGKLIDDFLAKEKSMVKAAATGSLGQVMKFLAQKESKISPEALIKAAELNEDPRVATYLLFKVLKIAHLFE